MKNMKKKILISLSILVVSLAAIAWAKPFKTTGASQAVKITGGGMLIDSSNGQRVATLTLQCHNCDSTNNSASGKFNLVDHQTGAHLKGNLAAYVQCTPNSDPNGLDYATDCKLFCNSSYLPDAHLLYGKADTGAPLAVCIQDNGNGNTDRATVVIPPSGSSATFRRFDTIVQGNFKVH